jgi:formamidopyrimidine-DNA glycosylase
MPELPEVQTIVSDLQSIIGETIIDFFSDTPKALKNDSPESFLKKIKNKKISSIERIAKNILISLENKTHILIHLKMTGKLLIIEPKLWNIKQKNKHTHHAFILKKIVIEFNDVRKFATLEIISQEKYLSLLKEAAIDPQGKNFTFENFSQILKTQAKKKIKPVLMDSKIISGIGNIYASEILFDAKVLPERTIQSLTLLELKNIFTSTLKIITKAVKLRGTSISDYRDAKGKKGSYQNHLFVYQKYNQKCQKCATIISRSVIAQRSSFFCSNCQK